MRHLKAAGAVVFLQVGVVVLHQRLGDAAERGIVRAPGQSFDDLYAERLPLYRRYADHTIDCNGLDHEGVVETIIKAVADD